MPGVDAGDLSRRVVVIGVELIGGSVRVYLGKLAKLAVVVRRCHVGPCVFVEKNDLNAHRFAGRDGVFELLRGAQAGIGVVQWKIPVLASNLPSGQLNRLHAPALARFRIPSQILIRKGKPVFGRVDLDLLP